MSNVSGNDDTSENEEFVRKECFKPKLREAFQNEDENMENIFEGNDNLFSYSEEQDYPDNKDWIVEENVHIKHLPKKKFKVIFQVNKSDTHHISIIRTKKLH